MDIAVLSGTGINRFKRMLLNILFFVNNADAGDLVAAFSDYANNRYQNVPFSGCEIILVSFVVLLDDFKAKINNEKRVIGKTDTPDPEDGCTNPDASNFKADAMRDDGSCIASVKGCMDPAANNYDPMAVEDDGSCDYGTAVLIKEGLEHKFISIQNRSSNITITLAVPAAIEIKSVDGQSVMNVKRISRTHTLSNNKLKPGVYFLLVKRKGASLMEKFMVY